MTSRSAGAAPLVKAPLRGVGPAAWGVLLLGAVALLLVLRLEFGAWRGEAIAVDGSRQELQLKGAGPTPYSRTADGRAVLRSSVREFVCSEAMHHLGVPTTRALSLVATGEPVLRDMFYDGRPDAEPGAAFSPRNHSGSPGRTSLRRSWSPARD